MNLSGCKKAIALFLCTVFLFGAAASVFPAAAETGDSSDTRRKVRVGYYNMTNFQEYDAVSGSYRGYSYDYMLAIAQLAGWEYVFVPVTYEGGMQMLENGDLDLMNNIQITDTLSQKLSFSALPSGTSCTCLVVSQDNTDVSYEDFDSIGNLTVGLDYSSSMTAGFIDYCKDHDCMPQLIYYHNTGKIADGMNSREINAYLVDSLQDVAMRTVAKFDTRSYYFATSKGNSDLLQELNAAMNSLKTSDPYFEDKIYAKYHRKSFQSQTVISDEERSFASESPTIRVAFDSSWYPIAYADDNQNFSGAMSSLFGSISQKTGLTFEYVSETPSQALEDLKAGRVQVLAGFPYDYTWAAKYNAWITDPFTTLTVFAAYTPGKDTGENTYAVFPGSYLYYLSENIRNDGYQYTVYASGEQCLSAVMDGKSDFAFLDSYQVEYYRERSSYRKLAFKVLNGEDYGLSVAISHTADERLYTIINKALAAMGADEIGTTLRETAEESSSRTLIDTLYANPRTAGVLFLSFGFLIAVAISALIYTRVMRKKNVLLRTATNAKSDFLSNMSHDMRTPLNGIIGYTDLALETKDQQERVDYLQKIKISGQFLLTLINDTLDISKIESGKYTLTPAPVNIEELLSGIVIPVRQAAEAKGVHFLTDTAQMPDGYILTDRLNLQKVILNLLSNAVKFTPENGTVTLIIAAVDPPQNGYTLRITVKDTGIGISDDFVQKVFEPFTQEPSAQRSGSAGTGLGLAIVKNIVNTMGGEITLQTVKGKGSQFDVMLPIQRLSDYHEDEAQIDTDAGSLAGRRILLCEDNAINREIAGKLLQSCGAQVVYAENGRVGTDLFAQSSENFFDVILMDLRMPVLDGYEASKAIRALPREDAKNVPILAISADAYESDLKRCRECGIDAHIPKPIDKTLLIKKLSEYCGKHHGDEK